MKDCNTNNFGKCVASSYKHRKRSTNTPPKLILHYQNVFILVNVILNYLCWKCWSFPKLFSDFMPYKIKVGLLLWKYHALIYDHLVWEAKSIFIIYHDWNFTNSVISILPYSISISHSFIKYLISIVVITVEARSVYCIIIYIYINHKRLLSKELGSRPASSTALLITKYVGNLQYYVQFISRRKIQRPNPDMLHPRFGQYIFLLIY